jgi:hypothetical protein
MRRQESFPWIIVMGGAVLYWTIALGIGIPSLYRLLGEPGPARRVNTSDTRCVQAHTVDGRPVFDDCINVRFLIDVPDSARGLGVFHQHTPQTGVLAGPDPEVESPIWNPTLQERRHAVRDRAAERRSLWRRDIQRVQPRALTESDEPGGTAGDSDPDAKQEAQSDFGRTSF